MSHLLILLCLQDVEQCIRDFTGDDPGIRETATQALVKAGLSAVPKVAKLMESEDSEVVARAETVLRKIGLPGVPILDATGSRRLKEIARKIVGEKAQEYLKDGDHFTVQWNDPPDWKPSAKIQTGTGSGHGFSLAWTEFQPKGENVDVLSVTYSRGWKPCASKWPPEDTPVVIKKARMKSGEYQAMLCVLATIGSATITEKRTNRFSSSSADFYSFARVTRDENHLFEDEFAGYSGTSNAPRYAKVLASTNFVQAMLKSLDLKEHTLDKEERLRLSQRFVRDWKRIEAKKSFYWWVKERLLILVGAGGDESALPLLTGIIREGNPKERTTYHAINAATRLLGTDVRENPVEEMDVESTRKKLLPLLEKK